MNLVTGASGLLGSHIVEQLRLRGLPVRTLVRSGSDRSWLETQGVEFAVGDVTDPASLAAACAGVDVVYHSAAKVGDWGPWDDFQHITIDGTQNVIAAAIAGRVRRLVHISSISTYGYHTKDMTVDETFDLGYKLYRWAYYSKSKVAAERLVWEAHRAGRIEVTVIRPAWIYGPRDRTTIERLYTMIRTGRAKILGRGDNRLNVVYAGNIAEAAIAAAARADCNGEAFNISNDGVITQQEYFDLWARTIGAEPVRRHAPYKAAYFAGFVLECLGHLLKSKKPPFITRYAVWLMGRRSYFSAEKARQKLGWKSTVTYDVGVPLTVKWYLEQGKGEDARLEEVDAVRSARTSAEVVPPTAPNEWPQDQALASSRPLREATTKAAITEGDSLPEKHTGRFAQVGDSTALGKPTAKLKQCRKCKEWIGKGTIMCPHCRTTQSPPKWAWLLLLVPVIWCCGPWSSLWATPKVSIVTDRDGKLCGTHQVKLTEFSRLDGTASEVIEHAWKIAHAHPDLSQLTVHLFIDKEGLSDRYGKPVQEDLVMGDIEFTSDDLRELRKYVDSMRAMTDQVQSTVMEARLKQMPYSYVLEK